MKPNDLSNQKTMFGNLSDVLPGILGNVFTYGRRDPTLQLIDMFHAGSPNSVKEHIINEMGCIGSHLRIMICIEAFSMGINCKDTYCSIHFGPPKTVEFLVQKSGRIGQDGKKKISCVLYKGLLSSQCNGYMKQLMQTKACWREHISNLFCVLRMDQVRKTACVVAIVLCFVNAQKRWGK